MKKSLLSMLVLVNVLMAQANTIEQQKAQELANQFLTKTISAQPNGRRAATQPNLTFKDLGFRHLYTFTDEAGGFVVVAGDDRVDPILAYSTTDVLDPNRIPESMQIMLLGYDMQISNLPQGVTPRHRSASPQRKVIAPLIKTMWHQYLPFCYNCPFDEDEGRNTLVGCVALTLAQLMNYYQYPASTTVTIPAYTTIDGYNMPALEPTTFNYSKLHINYPYVYSREEVDASDPYIQEINKLMMYAGCAVQMNYSTHGSSAFFDTDLIAKYFGYDKKCRRLSACNYPHDVWEEMIYNELQAGRPVPYSGGALMGQNHMFIIDGYDGEGYFHANIGENGWGSDNVYYKLDVINTCDVQTGPVYFSGYNLWQTAYFGFQPDKGNDALPKVEFDYGDYTLPQSDYTRSGANADFQNVELKAEMERYEMNSQTLDYGWGLFQNGLLKQVAGYATTDQEKASANMKLTFGSTLEDGIYQFYPIFRYHGATEWESYMEFGYTDEQGNKLRHYTATIQGNSLQIGLSSLDPNITIDKVDYYCAYENQKLNVRAFLTNGGTNYENHLLIWVDGELKGGVGIYVDPGKSGQADFCFPAPTKGAHAVKITTDDQGNDVIYNGQVTITDAPTHTLEGKMELKGVDEKNTIYKNCTVTCTFKNTGTSTFDNLVQANLHRNLGYDKETGNLIIDADNGIPSIPWRRVWYLHLEPGESTTVSFGMGECVMTEEFEYALSLSYYSNVTWETLDYKEPKYVNHILGDANGDGLLNVTDIVATVNFIMEKPSDDFNKKAADLNGDGDINVTDIVKMVSIIMSGNN